MRRKETEAYKTALYYDSVADGIESLLLHYDHALADDRELSEALALRGIPACPNLVSMVRRERGIGNKWQRMRQHLQEAQEWAESQQERH